MKNTIIFVLLVIFILSLAPRAWALSYNYIYNPYSSTPWGHGQYYVLYDENDNFTAYNISASVICIGGDCKTSWPSGAVDHTHDQGLNTTQGPTFANVTVSLINSTNWQNVTITEGQISDLSHTTDTDTNATSACTTGEVLLGDTDTDGPCVNLNNTIDTRTESTTYNVTTVVTISGTLDDGDVTSIHTPEDDESYNVSEAAGANPLLIEANFTGVTDFDSIIGRIYYDGGRGHEIQVEILRTDTLIWENYIEFTDTTDFVNFYIPVFDPINHIDSGNVSVRFNHFQNGIPTHNFYIDYLALVDGWTALTTADHDGLGGRDSTDNHPWALAANGSRALTANWPAGAFNISFEWYTGTMSWDNLTGYPADCNATSFVRGVGDTLNCEEAYLENSSYLYYTGKTLDFFDQLLNNTINTIIKTYNYITGSYYDQSLNTTSGPTFENITVSLINNTNWQNVTILESQVSDLSHTTDTDTNASSACAGTTTYLDGEGNCDDIATAYVNVTGDEVDWINVTGTINVTDRVCVDQACKHWINSTGLYLTNGTSYTIWWFHVNASGYLKWEPMR